MKKIKYGNIEIYTDFTDSLLSYLLVQFNGGRLSDPEGKEGTAHFLEHMLFKGTKKYNKFRIKSEIEQYGGRINAMTSFEEVFLLTETLNEHLDKALNIIGDICHSAIFDSKEMEKERNVISDEIKLIQDEPDYIVMDICTRNTLGVPAEIGGSEESIKNISINDLKKEYRRIINTNNMKIYYSGGLSEKELVKSIDKYMQSIKTGKKLSFPEYKFRGKDHDYTNNHLSNVSYNYIIGFSGKTNTSPFDKSNLEVLDQILSGGLSSILFKELRDKRDLCYRSSFTSFFLNKRSILNISVETNKEKLPTVKKVVKNIINKVCEKINKRDLKKVLAQIKVEHIRRNTIGIARVLWIKTLDQLGLNSTKDYFDLLNSINTSTVLDISNRIFTKNKKCEITIFGEKEITIR